MMMKMEKTKMMKMARDRKEMRRWMSGSADDTGIIVDVEQEVLGAVCVR